MDFETWIAKIDELAAKDNAHPGSYVAQTGTECWRAMYDDGMTPEEAWSEEVYAAQTMG